MNKALAVLSSAILSATLVFALSGAVNSTLSFKSEADSNYAPDNMVYRESWQITYTTSAGYYPLDMQFNAVVWTDGKVSIDLAARNYQSNQVYTLGVVEYNEDYYDLFYVCDPQDSSSTNLPIATILSYSGRNARYEIVQKRNFATGQRVQILLNPKSSPKGSGTITAFGHEIDVSATELAWSSYDVNTDGVVNTLDILSLKKYMLGYTQIDDLPIQSEPTVTDVAEPISVTTVNTEVTTMAETTEVTTETSLSDTEIEIPTSQTDPFKHGDLDLTVYDIEDGLYE